jgi:hypothetical protein
MAAMPILAQADALLAALIHVFSSCSGACCSGATPLVALITAALL